MKLQVVKYGDDTGVLLFDHEAPWVDHDTQDGELRVTLREADNTLIGWTLYASGAWDQVDLVELADPEVMLVRHALKQQGLTGDSDMAVPGGNSGPV